MSNKRYDSATVQDERLTIRLSSDRYLALRLDAAVRGETVGLIIRQLIDEYLALVANGHVDEDEHVNA